MIARVIISADLNKRVEEANRILSEAGISPNHPDLLYFPKDSKLGMEQARQIREFFSLKPYSGKGRAVVLEDAPSLTTEAQNALLKTLEEPPEEAILLLGASSDANFLPTILSRCEIVIIPTVSTKPTPGVKYVDTFGKDIEQLLNQDIGSRFEYIEKLKDKRAREDFLHAIVNYFHNTLVSHPSSGNVNFLKELITAEEWAEANVNIRGILEYLMLVMPAK